MTFRECFPLLETSSLLNLETVAICHVSRLFREGFPFLET